MTFSRSAHIAGAVVFVFMVLLALASADRPPPPAFLLLVAILAGWCAVMAWLIGPAHRWGLARVMAAGAVGGALATVGLLVFKVATDPAGMDAAGLIGVAVTGVCGALAAATQWGLTRLLSRRRGSSQVDQV